MSAQAVPLEYQSGSPPVLFDPEGDVLTTDHLEAFIEEGRPMLNNYVRHVKVGGGQHGDVYLCHRINTRLLPGDPQRRIPVAMKSVKRNNPRAEQLKKIRRQRLPASQHTPVADKLNTTEAKIKREIAIMKKLRHPHVVRLYEVIDDRMAEKIYMVMEYLGGGEVKWRDDQNRPVLTVSQTRRILRDAILGLEYLHHQGIVHRDIKPANLLWTEDRRQVKIGDFGVSHFSYAQRLAAAGGKDTENDPHDPILLDESGLSRRAGTPAFLAPEVIYEHTHGVPGSISLNSSALHSSSSLPSTATTATPPGPDRPEITKSIDIWALGVTLYCLLFATTPFVASQSASTAGSEYSLYSAICNDDWPVPHTMGYDRIPSGGRHPHPNSEAASIIHLLDHFLQKNATLRITLDEVKHSTYGSQTHPWILKDLNDPKKWLQITSPTTAKINVSMNETSDAMSVVHFRWRWGKIARHVSSLFRTVRPASRLDSRLPSVVASDPHGQRARFTAQASRSLGSTPALAHPMRTDKEKEKEKSKGKWEAPKTLKRPSSKGSNSLRSKSIERWPINARDGSSTSTTVLQLQGSGPKARRGSDTKILDRATSTSPRGPSRPGSGGGEKRARFTSIFQHISNWRPNKYSPAHTPSTGSTDQRYSNLHSSTTMTARPLTAVTQTPNTRRSEEALRYYRQGSGPDMVESGNLTAARRASSWGQGDKDLTEIVSVQSVGHNLNEHEMNVGAGGVSRNGIVLPNPAPISGPSMIQDVNNGQEQLTPAVATAMEHQTFEDEFEGYGHPVYDDSSTIASGSGFDNDDQSWQRGSDLSDHDRFHDHPDDDDDTSGEEDEEGVVFAPRRHPSNHIDQSNGSSSSQLL